MPVVLPCRPPILRRETPMLITLSPALAEDVAEALAYALRYDERGKPRRTSAGWDFAAGIAAEHLVQHLTRAGFVVMRRRPRPAHTAG
jgi:hypothetical protein